ncbi:5'-3' exonuclease [Sporolactobacillus sp. THM19-2]|uniref:5'-3' exonuclease n=1 Tax=Sporolactobacillus sp. THM19-2 TaxID=2511171 RepID=UPI00101E89EC|nr:5'-3' exonuclease [Sporolactobacillus sp. THM19-2]RYL93245.1 5'-3' exonuclease [Sporolactobacillus sp. THM19-2]
MTEKPRLVIIDGMALLFRAFYATAVTGQFMFNDRGMPTNAVQGYLRHLLLAIEYRRPTHVAVCWDMKEKTFRHNLFQAYKGNRAAPPVELIPQFALAKQMTEAFHIPNIGLSGYEADDCIGTLAKKYQEMADVSIFTVDRDLLQLLDNHIGVHILQKGYGHYRSYTFDAFSDKYGVTPRQFIDVKALMGDSSDGYPGVQGIGEKTAFKLIRQFGSIDSLLNQLNLLPKGQRNKISTNLDMLRVSRKLAEIYCNVPLSFTLDRSLYQGIPEHFFDRVSSQGMKLVQYDLIRIKRREDKNRAVN